MSVVLSLGTWKLRVLSAKFSENSFLIDDIFEVKTPKPLIEGVFASYSINEELLGMTLKKIPSSLRSRIDRVILPDQFVTFKFSEISKPVGADEKERKYLAWRIRESLPESLTCESILDYQVLDVFETEDSPTGQILSVIIKENFINSLTKIFYENDIYPEHYEVDSINEINLYESIKKSSETDYCLMHLGNFCCNMSFIADSKLLFTRIFDRAGFHITENIAKYMNLDFEKAEEMKHSDTIIPGDQSIYRSEKFSYDFFNSVFNEFLQEIEMTYRSFDGKHQDHKKRDLVLAGGSASLKGLPEFLSRMLNIRCSVFSLSDDFYSLGKRVKKEYKISEYMSCLGSVSGDEQ
jgi:Tfp pilus assembly PilM family ATPase